MPPDLSGLNGLIAFITGTGGVIAVLIYIGRQGQKGEWLFKSVHDTIIDGYKLLIAELEKRLADRDAQLAAAIATAADERKRGDTWQQLYIASKNITDRQLEITTSAVQTVSGGRQ